MKELDWLGIIRHGQSTGNVAAASAEDEGLDLIDIEERDADVPLSDTGRDQAAAVGRWLQGLPADERPLTAVVSPYLRTRQTAEIALADLDIPSVRDERLRDRELGILDRLTTRGVKAKHPEEAERRARHGKFYYRPPGGESWADVLLRLRSLLRDVDAENPGGRVLLVGHDAVVSLVRCIIEGLEEKEVMETARATPIANCSITSWRRVGDDLEPDLFNYVGHLRSDEDAHPTTEDNVDAKPV
jgi:probable phosphoglycerate mutase